MKKIIKIALLVLCILFAFGITTSVKADYCVEGRVPYYPSADYHDVGVVKYLPAPYVPNIDENFDNDYAREYILSTTDYTEDEKQLAYYCIIGDEKGEANELYYKAIEYQKMRLAEKQDLITIIKDEDAKTSVSGENLVYGPIYLKYPYGTIATRREWAGAYYAFFDEDGNNISDKVKLCTLENGEYKEVSSVLATSGEMKGYYKITSGSYNKTELYISVSDRYLLKVFMKARSFQIVKTAEIHRYEGSIYIQAGSYLCNSCKSKGGIIKNGRRYSTSYTTSYEYIESTLGSPPPAYKDNVYGSGGTSSNRNFVRTDRILDGHTKKYHSIGMLGGGYFRCYDCGKVGKGSSCYELVPQYKYVDIYIYRVEIRTHSYLGPAGCGASHPIYKNGVQIQTWYCGNNYSAGYIDSQAREKVEETGEKEELYDWAEIEIELGATIEVEKKWDDYENIYEIRPERIYFNVYRSIDNENWELLKEDIDYVVSNEIIDKSTWKVFIAGLLRYDENGNEYHFKVEETPLDYYDPTYPDGNLPDFSDNPVYGYITIDNKLKHINMSGYVWIDGQTGIKPAVTNNGIMDDSEQRFENIVVYLYYKSPIDGSISKVAETVTDANGYYEFKDQKIGYYYVEFYYDGVHYEDTIKVENPGEDDIISKAFEDVSNNTKPANRRETFNSRFQTITYQKSNDGTTLNYNYSDKKSTLITNNEGATTIKTEFQMTAETPLELIKIDEGNLNLGLVRRGTDIALSTDVYDANVTINGQETTYTYNRKDNTIEIGTTQTSEEVSYNLNLYVSDYNYRIRDYANTQNFQEKDYMSDGTTAGITTGAELQVYVTYELNLQNQSTKTTRINEVKYTYDEKYTFVGLTDNSYSVQNQEDTNTLTINLNGLSLGDGETKTLYLKFLVTENNNAVNLGDFSNKAEITSYSTDEGLIDADSQPGNFVNNSQVEDDSDTAGGLKITVPSNYERIITGKVFDKEGNNVNDVIVQLIELKTVNGKIYEYIWQETVSGTNSGFRLNSDGSALETYSYDPQDGFYQFRGFIPGDYIVRFIYGDGTTYDMTGNVIKYNGQDYKSMPDANYKAEWYNSSSYGEGASVARDNEARRLETMAYSVEVNAVKGILLKLLNNPTVDDLNETEKEILFATYNHYYDPDLTGVDQVSNDVISKLLKEQTLKNTWMCAETSKIKVAVDTENIANTAVTTNVDGLIKNYVNSINNIDFGLELRPVTKIELKKYITGFKLVTANGQTLVNAYIDVNEYLNDTTDISNKVQGIKDNVTILDNVWQYEVVPTEINTIVDGANLEFEYTLVVRNTGDLDYLSAELANVYNNSDIGTYKNTLITRATEVKNYIRNGTYRTNIGNSVGASYYTSGTGEAKVLTEVINIRDYVNNDLTFVFAYEGKVDIDASASKTHRILRDDYSMQEATINTILKTTESTGKMENSGNAVMYTVTLGKNPISSTGNLSFDTYIAEVMSYTNAAGRRAMTSTPGNAEIVDQERREGKLHEIDEADTGRIQIGVATGEDEKTNYIIIIAVAVGIAVVAIGAYVVKKYIIK